MNDLNELVGAILVINAGSSSLKFGVYQAVQPPVRFRSGKIDRFGQPGSTITWAGRDGRSSDEPFLDGHDCNNTLGPFLDWLGARVPFDTLAGIGHRVVHGGPRFDRPVRIDDELLAELGRLEPFDPEHLLIERDLIEEFRQRAPTVTQVACFDTAFHRDLPDVARRLPLPRRYYEQGVRRYGFHGLSFAFLMEELTRQSGGSPPPRVVLAHLGNGSSLAAVRDGSCIDTSMGFTPTGGIPMSTRSGDLDPGVIQYLWASDGMTPQTLRELTNRQAGLLGVSDVSGDLRELLARESSDPRCHEAIDIFCYAVRKQIGGYAAALGGLDDLVFAGGIGENAPAIRSRICLGLGFLGINLDEARNAAGEGIISVTGTAVTVRVIPTDEEGMIARETLTILRA